MEKISSEQYELFVRFYYLLDLIEEGLQYVIQSFENIERTERDRVLTDVVLAFYEMDSARPLLMASFKEGLDVEQDMERLDELIYLLEEIDFHKQQPLAFEHLVKYELYPTFSIWKQSIQKRLQAYITH